jgi:hypothetical protein
LRESNGERGTGHSWRLNEKDVRKVFAGRGRGGLSGLHLSAERFGQEQKCKKEKRFLDVDEADLLAHNTVIEPVRRERATYPYQRVRNDVKSVRGPPQVRSTLLEPKWRRSGEEIIMRNNY